MSLPKLPRADYRGVVHCAFTVCVEGRQAVLASERMHASIRSALARAAAECRCIIPIYCAMPDHLHVMFTGTDDEADTRLAMTRFKASHGKWLAENRAPWRWQRGFYDHRIRGGSDWRNHARYLAMNPVRAGLAREMGEYPFAGTIGVEWSDVFW